MAVRKPIIAGNWKSNPKTVEEIATLCQAFNQCGVDASKVDVVICPTALHCAVASNYLTAAGPIKVGVQNVSKTAEGAYTGEITANMVRDSGIEWAIIGHSERRHKFGETNKDLVEKVKLANAVPGLNIMFCIGELLEEREQNRTVDVIKEQVQALVTPGVVSDWSRMVLAYEPVWAIGTGKVATPQQADEAHKCVRQVLTDAGLGEVAASIRILYGGSVTPDNCKELIALPDVDGFLVGGASLKPSFVDIIRCAV